MELTIELPTARLEEIVAALHAEGKALGLDMRHLAWELAANACYNMIKYSPPMTGKKGWGKVGGENFEDQRIVGEGAVLHDLDRAFAIYDEPDREHWAFDGKYYTRKSADRAVTEVPPERWMNGVGDIARKHRSLLDSHGRIKRQPKQNWAAKKHFWAYVKSIQKHVGRIKAGWLDGYRRYAALTNKSVRIPSWIARHSTPSSINDTVTETGDGRITVANGSKNAKAIRRSQILFVHKMMQNDADKWLEKRAEKIAARIEKGGGA